MIPRFNLYQWFRKLRVLFIDFISDIGLKSSLVILTAIIVQFPSDIAYVARNTTFLTEFIQEIHRLA